MSNHFENEWVRTGKKWNKKLTKCARSGIIKCEYLFKISITSKPRATDMT